VPPLVQLGKQKVAVLAENWMHEYPSVSLQSAVVAQSATQEVWPL
jgi:hypothetical protein